MPRARGRLSRRPRALRRAHVLVYGSRAFWPGCTRRFDSSPLRGFCGHSRRSHGSRTAFWLSFILCCAEHLRAPPSFFCVCVLCLGFCFFFTKCVRNAASLSRKFVGSWGEKKLLAALREVETRGFVCFSGRFTVDVHLQSPYVK